MSLALGTRKKRNTKPWPAGELQCYDTWYQISNAKVANKACCAAYAETRLDPNASGRVNCIACGMVFKTCGTVVKRSNTAQRHV